MVKKFFLCVFLFQVVFLATSCKGENRISRNMLENDFRKKSFGMEPVNYIIEKLKKYDLVMLGERHWTHQEPAFLIDFLKQCYQKNAINVLFFEFGHFDRQGKLDEFMGSPQLDNKAITDILQEVDEIGWGYQEYYDVFAFIYNENRKRPPSGRIRLVLVDSSLSVHDFWVKFNNWLNESNLKKKEKINLTSWMNDSYLDRDYFMSNVIEMYLQKTNYKKGLYYAGSSHIRKDLQLKNYGRRFYSTGGILAEKYPEKIFCITFHLPVNFWSETKDFEQIEDLCKGPIAFDTQDLKKIKVKLKSSILEKGVFLHKAFDGYIMLSKDDEYTPCNIIPGFYDDDFAKKVWGRLNEKDLIKKLPEEFQKYQQKAFNGKELEDIIYHKLHR